MVISLLLLPIDLMMIEFLVPHTAFGLTMTHSTKTSIRVYKIQSVLGRDCKLYRLAS